MRHSPRLLLSVGLGLLSGACSTPFVPPPAGAPTALLRFRTNTPYKTTLLRVETRACPAEASNTFVAALRDGSSKPEELPTSLGMLGASGQPEPRVQERPIEAGRAFYANSFVMATLATGLYTCETSGKFLPEAGRQYELEFISDMQARTCQLRLSELARSGDGKVVKSPAPLQPIRTRNFLNSFCQVEG